MEICPYVRLWANRAIRPSASFPLNASEFLETSLRDNFADVNVAI